MRYTREYFYRIDAKGRLYHDNTEQTDSGFLDFFFRRLKINDTGHHPEYPYISPCGKEMNFVRSAGAPVVFRKLEENRSLVYAGSLTQPWEPMNLRIGSDDQLYHPSPMGPGRISPDLLLQWEPYFLPESGSIAPEGPFSHLSQPLQLQRLSEEDDRRMSLPPEAKDFHG